MELCITVRKNRAGVWPSYRPVEMERHKLFDIGQAGKSQVKTKGRPGQESPRSLGCIITRGKATPRCGEEHQNAKDDAGTVKRCERPC